VYSDAETGCIVPAAQAGAVGLLSGLATLAVANWQAWNSPGWLALAVGSGAALTAFVSGVSAWRRAAYPAPVRPAPASDPGPDRVRVEFVQPGDGPTRQTQLADLDATPAQLRRLAEGLLAGTPFAEGYWIGGGRPFSKAQFSALRAEFMRRGWASWRNPAAPNQGVDLTSQGRAVMRAFSSDVDRPVYKGFRQDS
jgi:hypothetical protein